MTKKHIFLLSFIFFSANSMFKGMVLNRRIAWNKDKCPWLDCHSLDGRSQKACLSQLTVARMFMDDGALEGEEKEWARIEKEEYDCRTLYMLSYKLRELKEQKEKK